MLRRIKELPRASLCNLPTPLNDAPGLSARLGGPRILIKRDDLTGLAMGGNKSRMLEFLLGDAKNTGSDVIITAGTPQGNESCHALAGASKLGMETILFVLKGSDEAIQGNHLLYYLLATEVKPIDIKYGDFSTISKKMNDLADELKSKGRKPYVLHLGVRKPLKTIGYVLLAGEICTQLQEKGIKPQYLFLASASGCTQAGLTLGAKYFGAPFKVIGTRTHSMWSREEHIQRIAQLANETGEFLDIDTRVEPHDVTVIEGYQSSSHAPTSKSIQAIRLLAKAEGIFIDPAYTGKAMAALIDQVQEHEIKSNDTVIFYHTGGLPAIFASNERLLAGA
ncbi:MAG: pyridoxal-phosphate dependent enzyme [Chloroflexi bacterium]|nr:pyridoxal-phosphate dependent enzyme [Chloroflexota bacterium]